MAQVYVGYAHRDRELARQLSQALLEHGYTITPADESDGDSLSTAAEDALRHADVFIYIHSPSAAASVWLKNELVIALSLKKPIIPVLLTHEGIPPALVNYHFIDAERGGDGVIQAVLLAVDAVTSFPTTPPLQPQQTAERAKTLSPAPVAAAPAPALTPQPTAPKRSSARVSILVVVIIIVIAIVAVVILSSLSTSSLSGSAVEEPTLTHSQQATSTAQAIIIQPTFLAASSPAEVAFAATVNAVRAADDRSLSANELALIAPLVRNDYTSVLLLMSVVALSALILSGATLILAWRGDSWQRLPKRAHAPHHGQASGGQAVIPAPLLADFQIFVSSSEKDRQWVERLVADLTRMDYLVWWYAKDAPGLPFGNEIRSAIYHTKIFMIVLSPDSMASKHVEEEIRWAEIYDRPIIPVLHRPISVEQRLYGLAKGADIDFADTRYRDALELLAQAVDHYLEKRLEALNVTPV